MKYNFHVSIETRTRMQEKVVQKKLEMKLNEITDYICHLASAKAEKRPSPISDGTKNIASYAGKLAQLESNLALFAHDFGVPSVYGSKIKNLKKQKRISPTDATFIHDLEILTKKSPLLGRMKRFLIELPKDPAFDELRLLQQLTTAHIDMDSLAKHPTKIEGHVLHAFEQYHAVYVATYLTHLSCYEAAIADWQKGAAAREQTLFVIAALDNIPALGAATADTLTRDLAAIDAQYRRIDINESDRRTILQLEPSIAGVTFFTPHPTKALQTMSKRIDAALRTKLAGITEASVSAALQNSGDHTIAKITQLANLTQLDQLTKLFTKKTAPKIVRALQQLLTSPLITQKI